MKVSAANDRVHSLASIALVFFKQHVDPGTIPPSVVRVQKGTPTVKSLD